MYEDLVSEKLLYTERGQKWINQFENGDRANAEKLVKGLSLVSHNEFERSLLKQVEGMLEKEEGVVALFAVREVEREESFFQQSLFVGSGDQKKLDSLSRGNDHGSEARVAAMIRNLCKRKKGKLLNHPDISTMRERRCKKIVFVDDFIGSGKRVNDYLDSFWRERTIVSWMSLKYLEFSVVAYSGTIEGIERVCHHKSRPVISIVRSCPTLFSMPWIKPQRSAVVDLCNKYGSRAHKNRRMYFGFRGTMGMLIFEHGCPNNVPAILWGSYSSSDMWEPLFPNRSVAAEEGSIFPHEIVRGDPISTLLDVGQKRLAKSDIFNRLTEEGRIVILILGLLAKGQRKNSSLSFVTGLDEADCEAVLEKCVDWELITLTRRLRPKGLKELQAARETQRNSKKYVDIGSDYYYPSKLREATYG